MKLALMSDIHANIQALEACLAHAQAQGVGQYAFLGDLVGYGADPVAVVQRVQTLAAAGAWVLKGNHDAMAVAPPAVATTLGDSTAGWTHQQLSPMQRQFLDQLPLVRQEGAMLLVHATADEPALWRYVYDERAAGASLDGAARAPEVRYVFGGHVHAQSLYARSGDAGLMKFMPSPGVAVPLPGHSCWLATIGSVGQPRDGNPAAGYAVFDSESLQLVFHRVDYDHPAAARAIRRAGLPAFFADRLATAR
ncbi:MAG: hypothetical protein RIS90_1183 [Pseudomonadota bacterium]